MYVSSVYYYYLYKSLKDYGLMFGAQNQSLDTKAEINVMLNIKSASLYFDFKILKTNTNI